MKIVSTINARSSAFECVTRFCANTLFGDSAGDRLIWFLNRSNLVLEEDGCHHRPRRRQHLHIYRGTQRGGAPRVLGGHFKAQFLKGFKKNQQGQVTRVQDFMMPSFTLKNKQVEVISDVSTSSSDLFSQLSSIMDQKIADIYI